MTGKRVLMVLLGAAMAVVIFAPSGAAVLLVLYLLGVQLQTVRDLFLLFIILSALYGADTLAHQRSGGRENRVD